MVMVVASTPKTALPNTFTNMAYNFYDVKNNKILVFKHEIELFLPYQIKQTKKWDYLMRF